MSHARAEALGGPILTRPFKVLLGLFGLGTILVAWRFLVGLGPSTGLNDAYPWGLWIAFDVVTGTALACGGYAVAILAYVFNKGQYHPLVRPALLTSALGYTTAAVMINADVGRPWYVYRIPISFWQWNLNSALLEVALCVMAYIVVLWIELSPAFLEKFGAGPEGALKRISRRLLPLIEKSLIWFIALGLLLPTMHQSSLGTVMLLTGQKLHRLWHTPLLPLLFLVSCVAMGYAVVVFESALSSVVFRRPRETKMLGSMAPVMAGILIGFLVLRFGDIALRGRLGSAFAFDGLSLLFWAETALFLIPAILLLDAGKRGDLGHLFRASMLMMAAGTVYRFDTYIVAFNPGDQYAYFPTVPEILISVGVVALEVLAYVLIVKIFPILGGARRPAMN